MSKRIIAALVIVIVVVGAVALVSARRRAVRDLPAPVQEPLPVEVAAVTSGSVFGVVSTTALVRADWSSTVSAQVGGAILETRVREGDRVRAGQLLARIDARPLDDAVGAASARLAAADRALSVQKAVFDRDTVLRDGGAISQQAFDASTAQLELARASAIAAGRALSTARVQRAYSNVTAPYSGVITARLVEAGDLATPGKPLFNIERPGKVRIISKLSQTALERIRPGAAVAFSWHGQSVHAQVSQIYPALDASSLGSVETLLPSSPFALPNGASIHADYATAPVSGLTVPNEAMYEGLGSTLVVRVVAGKADPVPVHLLAGGTRRSAIDGAIAAGDVVVIGLPSELMALTKGTPLKASPGMQP